MDSIVLIRSYNYKIIKKNIHFLNMWSISVNKIQTVIFNKKMKIKNNKICSKMIHKMNFKNIKKKINK